MSSAVTRPSGPDPSPRQAEMSSPFSLAKDRARGEANTRADEDDEEDPLVDEEAVLALAKIAARCSLASSTSCSPGAGAADLMMICDEM